MPRVNKYVRVGKRRQEWMGREEEGSICSSSVQMEGWLLPARSPTFFHQQQQEPGPAAVCWCSVSTQPGIEDLSCSTLKMEKISTKRNMAPWFLYTINNSISSAIRDPQATTVSLSCYNMCSIQISATIFNCGSLPMSPDVLVFLSQKWVSVRRQTT